MMCLWDSETVSAAPIISASIVQESKEGRCFSQTHLENTRMEKDGCVGWCLSFQKNNCSLYRTASNNIQGTFAKHIVCLYTHAEEVVERDREKQTVLQCNPLGEHVEELLKR